MPQFATKTSLPRYLRVEQEKIEKIARGYGLDFFPTLFEMVSYDQMNEIAAYGGFPTRYPHWRFGMEYERLSKSTEYGLSKIYELVVNNNPGVAYLLEGNSLTDQKLVMAHVYAHVDFFKNNFAFKATNLGSSGAVVDPTSVDGGNSANRKWVDRLANHGSIVRRIIDRRGIVAVESLIDHCLSLENLIDPWSPFVVRRRAPEVEDEDDDSPVTAPRLKAKEYMESFINPEAEMEKVRDRLKREKTERDERFPAEPMQDVLLFLIEEAPLEKWERDVLTIIRDEAYYFAPQGQTKIMNEGWASYWHSRMMTEKICDANEILDYADNNAAVMATSKQQLNPYKLGVELYRNIEERWDRGQFGREWEECDRLDRKRSWDLRLGLGREKIFEVRALYNDVTFIDEFLTPEFAASQNLFNFDWSSRNERYEIASREFAKIKEKLLFQLTNAGNPFILVEDGNFENRGELLLRHEHRGVDLRADYGREALQALNRLWKRPVNLRTIQDEKPVILRFDGKEHGVATLESE